MAASKSIQIILARQLASCVATPILLVDATGTLIFYNEPAEAIFHQRFDETGEVPPGEWTVRLAALDDDRKPIAPEDRPMMRVLSEFAPLFQTLWIKRSDGEWRPLRVNAFPLIGERDESVGARSMLSRMY